MLKKVSKLKNHPKPTHQSCHPLILKKSFKCIQRNFFYCFILLFFDRWKAQRECRKNMRKYFRFSPFSPAIAVPFIYFNSIFFIRLNGKNIFVKMQFLALLYLIDWEDGMRLISVKLHRPILHCPLKQRRCSYLYNGFMHSQWMHLNALQ